MKTLTSQIRLVSILISLSLLMACSSSPKSAAPIIDAQNTTQQVTTPLPQHQKTKGFAILNIAENHLGTPYVYGGSNPSGFDCSGLVQYSHNSVGIKVPRTAAAQYHAAQTVNKANLKPGDVIFFRLNWKKVSHVGIYAGQGRFIHSPKTGKHVSFSSIDEPYWRKRIAKTGRFY